jgi:hypothetical protein
LGHDVASARDAVAELHFVIADATVGQKRGGEPNAGRYLRHWFREAGFVQTRVTTSTVSYSDPGATREWADTYADRTLHSNIAEKSLEYGLATRSELEAIAASWRTWARIKTRSGASATPK